MIIQKADGSTFEITTSQEIELTSAGLLGEGKVYVKYQAPKTEPSKPIKASKGKVEEPIVDGEDKEVQTNAQLMRKGPKA